MDLGQLGGMMATSQDPQRSAPVTPDAVERTSTPTAMGSGDYSHFVWVQLSELQKSVTQVDASVQNLKSSLDGLKTKVDDLVAWKHRIIGGAIVFGAICTVLGFAVSKLSDYVTIKAPAAAVAPAK